MKTKHVFNRFTAKVSSAVIISLILLSSAISAEPWDNTRISLDLSVRAIYETNSENFDSIQFAGVDMQKIFSGKKGDIGTLLVQIYGTSLLDVEAHPPIFKDKNDTEVVYRNVYFNYTALSRGTFNIKLGHFEVPFGIEQIENTNGTLKDYMHGPNLGVKADWGVSLNGSNGQLEYEIALMRGSGNNWENRGDPYIIAGRLGTPRHNNTMLGLSFFKGDVSRPFGPEPTIRRSRIAIDGHWYWRRFEFIGEISKGKDAQDKVFSSILEADFRSMNGTWLSYAQFRILSYDRVGLTANDDSTALVFGLEYEPDNHWSLNTEFSKDIDSFSGKRSRNLIKTQIRYRF